MPVLTKRRNAFHVEASTHPETGCPEWDVGGVWGTFRAIGFVPRPSEPVEQSGSSLVDALNENE